MTRLESIKGCSNLTGVERNKALTLVRNAVLENISALTEANGKDIERGKKEGLDEHIIHRLSFDKDKIEQALKGLDDLISLEDPIGKVLLRRELAPSLILEKITVPIGVIGAIFESRPDALLQISSLALKSGNAIVLKGGSEARETNKALFEIIEKAVKKVAPNDWIFLLETRDEVGEMLKMDGIIDLIIPRGSASFVRYVKENTKIPVLGHSDGLCAVYVDKEARLDKALSVVVDSKVQYPSACNAVETILVHESIAPSFLPLLSSAFKERRVKVRCEEKILPYFPFGVKAKDEDFDKEFLSLECSIKTVESIDEAICHINKHSSKHTDAIVTESDENKRKFFALVDSADVFCNASTRFADGYRFGFGAEVGISTGKIHSRGPVGLDGLMTTKYLLTGRGDTVDEFSRGVRKFTHKDL